MLVHLVASFSYGLTCVFSCVSPHGASGVTPASVLTDVVNVVVVAVSIHTREN